MTGYNPGNPSYLAQIEESSYLAGVGFLPHPGAVFADGPALSVGLILACCDDPDHRKQPVEVIAPVSSAARLIASIEEQAGRAGLGDLLAHCLDQARAEARRYPPMETRG